MTFAEIRKNVAFHYFIAIVFNSEQGEQLMKTGIKWTFVQKPTLDGMRVDNEPSSQTLLIEKRCE